MKYNIISSLFLLLFSLSILSACSSSQQAANDGAPATPPDKIEDATSGHVAMEGLFTVFQDTTDGSTKMLINEDQIGREFIYWGHTVDGVPRVGHFRGNYRDNKIFSIQRYFDRIEFVQENTSFHFDEDSPLSRASDANISRAVLFSASIEEETDDGRLLINSDPLFTSESLHQVKPSPVRGLPPGLLFTLGRLNSGKTKIMEINSYPENTAVVVEYVYDNPEPQNRGGRDVTSARAVSIKYQHTFIEVPDNDFEPRFADPRIGYFTQQIDDQTATGPTPWRDVINRWNLVQADPEAEISDPVEPITWWIENTTPEELRPIIKEATLRWNDAFEQAGFSNAIEVKVQPDTAEWDAGDIRYNVLRWTSSPTPPFGGYGPSFTNPRTGQIIGADIMLEFAFMRNAVRNEKLFSDEVVDYFLNMGQPEYEHQQHDESFGMHCSAGHFMHFSNIFGSAALKALGGDEIDEEQLRHDALVYLIMHELGHTFGLNHNMAGTTMLPPEDLHNRELTQEVGLANTVMDYPAINVALNPDEQGEFYTTVAGPYDRWAIEFGYSPALEDEEAEAERLRAIAERSTEPELLFGNDADDMRAPGKAIDPRIMIGDLSSDPVGHAYDRVQLVHNMLDNLLEKYSTENQSYQELYNAFMSSMGQMSTAMGVTSRQIGGVHIDRGFVGQPGSGAPYTPVPADEQRRAMESIAENLLAPDAFYESHEVYDHLQRQRRGFNFFSTSEDPKIHDLALNIQRNTLSHILHPNTTKRISDSRLYGNEYPLSEMMDDLTMAIFEADLRGRVNTFRQNLQIFYVNALSGVIDTEGRNPYDTFTRSAALYSLEQIQDMLENRPRNDIETQAHTRHVLRIVNNALDDA